MVAKAEPTAPAGRRASVPLAMFAIGVIVTVLVVITQPLLNSLPKSLASGFSVIFAGLLIIDGWLVLVGGLWLLVLAGLIASAPFRGKRQPMAPASRGDQKLAILDTILLGGFAIGTFFVYPFGEALLDALLFGLGIFILWYVIRTSRGA